MQLLFETPLRCPNTGNILSFRVEREHWGTRLRLVAPKGTSIEVVFDATARALLKQALEEMENEP